MIRILHITALVLLCLTGVVASGLLLLDHLYVGADYTWGHAACGESDEGGLTRFLTSLSDAWTQGARVDWDTFFAGSGARRSSPRSIRSPATRGATRTCWAATRPG